jgi:hypothetical protein
MNDSGKNQLQAAYTGRTLKNILPSLREITAL